MTHALIFAPLAALALVACAQPQTEAAAPAEPEWTTITTEADLRAQVVGRPIAYQNGLTITTEPDQTFSGDFTGAWFWEGDKFCREVTLVSSGREFPLQCQTLQVRGDQFRAIRPDGSTSGVATFTG